MFKPTRVLVLHRALAVKLRPYFHVIFTLTVLELLPRMFEPPHLLLRCDWMSLFK